MRSPSHMVSIAPIIMSTQTNIAMTQVCVIGPNTLFEIAPERAYDTVMPID